VLDQSTDTERLELRHFHWHDYHHGRRIATPHDARAVESNSTGTAPIKAGREIQGKMRTAWFWPVHGEQQEICFPYASTHQNEHIFKILGRHFSPDTVLLTDGNDSYARYAQAVGIEHAQCWSHNRRGYFEAKDYEPQRAQHALERVAKLYSMAKTIAYTGSSTASRSPTCSSTG
jgi:transposase